MLKMKGESLEINGKISKRSKIMQRSRPKTGKQTRMQKLRQILNLRLYAALLLRNACKH